VTVVDASSAIDYVTGAGERHDWVAEQLLQAGELYAPHLIDLEVSAALSRLARRGVLPPKLALAALDDFRRLPLRRYPHSVFLPRIWELRQSLSIYDAAYVALAEGLDVPLITTDRHIALAQGVCATVLVPPS
jgi:predicted nucleic acid-binding protein